MRVVHLTAGAGGRICGSCLHDNTLVRALRRQGADAVLLPAYVPTTTDEENVAEARVVLGGVNVWLQEYLPLFRHTPRFVDRLLDSTGLLSWLSRRTAATRPAALGRLTISTLRGEEGRQRKMVRRLVRLLADEARPDVVHLSNLLLCGLAPAIRAGTSASIVCTLSGEDLYIDQLAPADRDEVERLIARQSGAVDRFVALDGFYSAACVRRFRLPEARCEVIPHGVDLAGYPDRPLPRASVGDAGGGFPSGQRIGFLGRLCPEKGLHVLVEAMGMLVAEGRDLHLWVVGATVDSERDYIDRCTTRGRAVGLSQRMCWLGQIDRAEKLRFFSSIDLFAAPAIYPEAKGLPVLEAFAAGLPVVASAAGAFPEYLAESTSSERGLLHPPGDAAGLARRIAELLDDPARMERMRHAAHAHARAHHSAEVMASRHLRLYEALVAGRSATA